MSHDPDGICSNVSTRADACACRGRSCIPRKSASCASRFGYVDLSADEVMIDADHIVTVEGAEIIA
jgi:hypothetical protein